MESYEEADTRIEDLPEDVLCRIFSWLDMRDAARASASCSAFLRAWGRYPRLTFDEDTLRLRRPPYVQNNPGLKLQLRDEHGSCFVRHVDNIIASRRRGGSDGAAAALDALVVKFAYLRERDAACVDRWVALVLASTTTRLLRLDFLPHTCYSPDRLQYDLPCSLISAGTPAAAALEDLYLRLGSLRLQASHCRPGLTNLSTLVLSMVRVTSEDLEHLLSSCHKLQSLKLRRCENLEYFRVSRDRLKQLRLLVVKHCWAMRRIDVSGSAVESLRFNGRHLPASLLRAWTSVSVPAPKVTSANFDLQLLVDPAKSDTDSSRLQLLSLARLMPGLETLSLNLVRHVKVDMASPHGGNRFRHLKRVHIEMDMAAQPGRDDFLFLYPFLDAAPALEALSLDVRRYAEAFYPRRQIGQPDEASHFRNHQGLTQHSLRAVDITGFDADLASLELALYILGKARALQRMSLVPIWNRSYEGQVLSTWTTWNLRRIQGAIARYIAPAVPLGSGIVLQVK